MREWRIPNCMRSRRYLVAFDKHLQPEWDEPQSSYLLTSAHRRQPLVLCYPRNATYIAVLNNFRQMKSTLRRNGRSQPNVPDAMGHVVPADESGAKNEIHLGFRSRPDRFGNWRGGVRLFGRL